MYIFLENFSGYQQGNVNLYQMNGELFPKYKFKNI